jgi:uncharacterized protein YbjT (DUF2867 family)
MKVFVAGAGGFIGRRVAAALSQAGHHVIAGARSAPAGASGEWMPIDFTHDHDVSDWIPRLLGVHVVVNAVGILRERGTQTFVALHEAAPRAMFAACVAAGVQKVIQLSALGADTQAASRYHLSKRRADEFLASLPVAWVIVQPSLVFGEGGASARLFTAMASLPVILLPGSGEQVVQPIHVDDLCAALVRIAECSEMSHSYLPAVGARPVTIKQMLAALRAGLRLPPAPFFGIPMSLVRTAAAAASRVPSLPMDREAIGMLERGNTAAADAITQLLGRPPKPIEQFIAPNDAPRIATDAKLRWLLPVLRASVGLVWIITAIVSLGLYPIVESYALLERFGVPVAVAPFALYGAAALDLALGIGVFVLRKRRGLWRAQIALILIYSLMIAWRLPEFWLHPFGPLTKNLPMLAAILLLYELEPR